MNFFVILACLLPTFFALGWFAGRIDMKIVLKQAQMIPTAFYRALGSYIETKDPRALQEVMEERIKSQHEIDRSELGDTLGRLYHRRGQFDKAIALYRWMLKSPDLTDDTRHRFTAELANNYKDAGLVNLAESTFQSLLTSPREHDAREALLDIYQQDRDWQKAIAQAQKLTHTESSYYIEIAQFYCEIAQSALYRSDEDSVRKNLQAAFEINRKCVRASMILGDLETQLGHDDKAISAYSAIEQQNFEYLGMVGEKLLTAYERQNRAQEGLSVLAGFAKTFENVDLLSAIYNQTLKLNGDNAAAQLSLELVRAHPNLSGVHHLLGVRMHDNPAWRSDIEMLRTLLGEQLENKLAYRCICGFHSAQRFFWHCPACKRWESLTPYRTLATQPDTKRNVY